MQTVRTPLAPGISASDKVILFDGVCVLCSAWARFLIRFDRERRFKLATAQSDEGKAILAWYGLPTHRFDTMLLVEGERMHTQSEAFLRVVRQLPMPWPLLSTLRIIPKPVRDWLYDRVALNRYALFGKHDTCLTPTPDHESRFLAPTRR